MSAFVDKMQFLKSNIHYLLPLKIETLIFLGKNSTFHHGRQRGAWVATPLGTIGWRRGDIFCQWYTLCEVVHVSINNPPLMLIEVILMKLDGTHIHTHLKEGDGKDEIGKW